MTHPKNRFWSTDRGIKISFITHDPTSYRVFVDNAKKGDRLIFTDAYDQLWLAKIGSDREKKVLSTPYKKIINSFVLPKDGSYTVEVLYQAQKWVSIGMLVSIVTSIFLGVALIILILWGQKRTVKVGER